MVEIVIYVASWLLVFLVVGIIWYVLDRALGVHLYRWFYNMTHRDSLPGGVVRGFIHGQKARMRFVIAVILSIVQSGFIIASIQIANPLAELLSFFLQIPVVMGGFYLGPIIYRVWERKENLFEQMDRIESGEISIGKEIKEATQKAAEAVRDVLKKDEPPQPSPAQPEVSPQAEAAKKEPVTQSPWELMSKYLRRK